MNPDSDEEKNQEMIRNLFKKVTSPYKTPLSNPWARVSQGVHMHVVDELANNGMPKGKALNLLDTFAKQDLFDSLDITYNPNSHKVVVKSDLERFGIMFRQLIEQNSTNIDKHITETVDSMRQQCVEIEDQVSKDVIKGVQLALDALLAGKTLDNVLTDRNF